MANGGIIGPNNIPYIGKNVTSFTSTAPGGHTFHPDTTAVDYIVAAGGGGRNGPGIGNSGTGAGGLATSGDVGSFAEPVTGGGTTGAITIGAGGGNNTQGSASSIAAGGGLGPYSTVGGGYGVARGAGGRTGGSGSGGGDGYPNTTTNGGGISTPGQGNPGGPGGPGEPSGGGGGYGGAGGAPGGHPQYGPGPGYTTSIADDGTNPANSLMYSVGGNGEGAPGDAGFGNNTKWPGGNANGTGRANSGMGTLYNDSSAGIVVINENGGTQGVANGIWSIQEQFLAKKEGTWS